MIVHVKPEQHKWYSPALGRDMDMLVFGHGGAKLLVFPTTLGSYREWYDRHMHEVLGDQIENGWIQMYCVDHVHGDSWYNSTIHPGTRAWRHLQYDRYLRDEVVPFMNSRNPTPFTIATGASFGAYHAVSFAFRNPTLVNRVIGMSGLYDISEMTGGFSDATVYACNPSAFIRNEHEAERIAALQRQDIILTIGRGDPSFQNNVDLSATLWQKQIGNALRVSEGHAHDWPYWEKMIRRYISGHD